MLVSIVLATYKPNFQYFEKQLKSINNQTYKNIELIVRDDSDSLSCYNKIVYHVEKYITNFKYTILKNECNLGSNKTFELLTEDANGKYIAYCDQDDIWDERKIEKLIYTIQNDKSKMVYSDLSVIDEYDIVIANSLKELRKRLKHIYGDDIFKYIIKKNSVTGCTMLIESQVAKRSIPFSKNATHDHWLAINAAVEGTISYLNEPLVRYRIYSNNQIGIKKLNGIESKNEYLEKRLLWERDRYKDIKQHCELDEDYIININEYIEWVNLRIEMFNRFTLKNFIQLIRYAKYDLGLFIFEFCFSIIPEKYISKFITTLRSIKL